MTPLASAKPMNFIITRDRDKARAFYSDVLGFKVVGEDDFALVCDMNGTMLRISTLKTFKAEQHTVLGWAVADIEAAVKTLTARGVSFNRYPGFAHDELGIWSAPGSKDRVAWFLDPDGNNLSLAQF